MLMSLDNLYKLVSPMWNRSLCFFLFFSAIRAEVGIIREFLPTISTIHNNLTIYFVSLLFSLSFRYIQQHLSLKNVYANRCTLLNRQNENQTLLQALRIDKNFKMADETINLFFIHNNPFNQLLRCCL